MTSGEHGGTLVCHLLQDPKVAVCLLPKHPFPEHPFPECMFPDHSIKKTLSLQGHRPYCMYVMGKLDDMNGTTTEP